MLAQHRRWLVGAGATVAAGVAVEISPLVALDADDLRAHFAGTPPRFDKSTYLRRPE
jgi:hypothetical protein